MSISQLIPTNKTGELEKEIHTNCNDNKNNHRHIQVTITPSIKVNTSIIRLCSNCAYLLAASIICSE